MSQRPEVYVVDATRDSPDGLFCFCPLKFDRSGAVVAVVTGMLFVSSEPPHGGRYAGVFHEEGPQAAELWAYEHHSAHADFKARFGWT